MSELLAVEGASINHDLGSPISSGVFTITSVPSAKTKEEGKGVYLAPLTYTFAGGSASGFESGSVATAAPQTIPATALKTKDFGILVMRDKDSAIMNCIGIIEDSGGTTGPVSGPVIIDNPGQVKVRGA